MKKTIIFLAAYLCLVAGLAQAQEKGTVTLLKGTAQDLEGKPVGATIQFTDVADGKKFNVKSNSKDGSYQQPLTAGKSYIVLFKGYLAAERDITITVPPFTSYTEITREFTLQKLEPGVALFSEDAFNNDDYKLNEKGLAIFKQLKELLIFQGNITLTIAVRSTDVKKLQTEKTVVEKVTVKGKTKEKKKKLKIQPSVAREEFLNNRIAALKAAAKSIGIRESSLKFQVEEPISVDKKGNPKAYQSTVPPAIDILVKVDRILDL